MRKMPRLRRLEGEIATGMRGVLDADVSFYNAFTKLGKRSLGIASECFDACSLADLVLARFSPFPVFSS